MDRKSTVPTKMTKPALEPLKTIELLPARLTELLLFVQGEPLGYDYPAWVRAIGSDILPYLPPKFVAAIKKDPIQLLHGVVTGIGMAGMDNPALFEIAKEDVSWVTRSIRTVNHPFLNGVDVTKLHELVAASRDELGKEVLAKLTLPLPAKQAFFEGFACGMNLLEEFKHFAANKSAERFPLRLYLWLRWPEIVECESISAVYRKCRDQFAKKGAAEIVGTEQGFKKFCNRYGISFRAQQEAKRRKAKGK